MILDLTRMTTDISRHTHQEGKLCQVKAFVSLVLHCAKWQPQQWQPLYAHLIRIFPLVFGREAYESDDVLCPMTTTKNINSEVWYLIHTDITDDAFLTGWLGVF